MQESLERLVPHPGTRSILAAFASYIQGAQHPGWDFNEVAARLFAVGVLAGLLRRLGVAGTTDAFVNGSDR